MMVLESYLETFEQIWKLALIEPDTGVLLTGQPGIGKSHFLKYMLIRLLRKRQPVLLSIAESIIIFWLDGKAWRAVPLGSADYPMPASISTVTPRSIPEDPASEDVFIWSLIDADDASSPPPVSLFRYPMFPIQSASPNPKHSRRWMKQRLGAVTRTLPLWTKDKLLELLQNHKHFKRVDSVIKDHLRGRPAESRFVWEVNLREALNKALTPFTTENEAYDFLSEYAIYHYGFAARDFIGFFFSPSILKTQHQEALDTQAFADVERIIKEFQRNHTLAASSNRLVTVFSSKDDQSQGVSWGVDFKSPYIAKKFIEKLRNLQEYETVRLYRSLRPIPCAAAIAGWFFQPIAVRRLACNSGDLVLEEMLEGMDTDEDSHSCTTSPVSVQPTDVQLPQLSPPDEFPILPYNQIALSRLALNIIYNPDAQNNPLWDLLLITRELDLYVIWVFQMTTASNHKGSREGYVSIRRIMMEYEKQNRQDQRLNFEARYVLVSPDDGIPRTWNMPPGWAAGWDENTTRYNHQGSCYLVQIPIPDGTANTAGQR